jgi:hypothetical protein
VIELDLDSFNGDRVRPAECSLAQENVLAKVTAVAIDTYA